MGELIKNLSNKLRVLRREKEFSQENMAEMLNMSKSGYARIERAENEDIGLGKIEQIAEIFGMKPTELIQSAECHNNIQHVTNSTAVANNISAVHVGEPSENTQTLQTFFVEFIEALQAICEDLSGRMTKIEKKSKKYKKKKKKIDKESPTE